MAAKKREVDVRSRRTVYKGWCRVDEVVFDFDRAAGKGRITGAKREIFERGDSAAALVHDIERDLIVLTEQFRIATHDKGPGYLVEAMAGAVGEGEGPEDCLRREMMEEIGYRAGRLTLVSGAYASPGACSERIFI
jgi:ADP-ribose pyrophosphatase